jgi:hypothetical protein
MLPATRCWLSPAQKEQFIRDGYVVVPGLLSADVVASVRHEIETALGLDPDDAATWKGPTVAYQIHALTTPCRTAELEAAASELVGPHFLRGECFSPYLDSLGLDPVVQGYIPVLNYPRPGPPKFVKPNGFHIDGIHTATLWPDKHYLVILAYLSDTPEYGGATAVRPGSHRQLFAHWITQGVTPGPNELLADLPYAEPIPVPGKAGDVIFMHYLTVHSGSNNHSDHIRFALNGVIQPDPAHPYTPKPGPPQPDWTPLDWTLRTDILAADLPSRDGSSLDVRP